MAQFIAIPVGQGDAFYLDRERLSVLVDGGRSCSGFAVMFQNVTATDGIDIAVCTHNDADHTYGILGFLEAGLRCGEIWLPGRWLSVLPNVLKPFVEVFAELVQNVVKTDIPSDREQQRSGLAPIEAYANRVLERPREVSVSEDSSPLLVEGWPGSYVRMLEETEPWDIFPCSWLWPLKDEVWFDFFCHVYPRLGPSAVQLLWSAIEAAHRIRAIAIEAFHRGIPVRWFEFDATNPSGGIAGLQPINSRAVARVRPLVGRLLDCLALTVSNKESLVFWSPPTDDHPGVLFTADSDLSRLNLPRQLLNAIATSPHHGSEDNSKAYLEVRKAAQQNASSITWVRSDCRYRGRPGQNYLSLSSSRRLCTICRLGGNMWSPKQAVRLSSTGGFWVPQPPTATCSCQ